MWRDWLIYTPDCTRPPPLVASPQGHLTSTNLCCSFLNIFLSFLLLEQNILQLSTGLSNMWISQNLIWPLTNLYDVCLKQGCSYSHNFLPSVRFCCCTFSTLIWHIIKNKIVINCMYLVSSQHKVHIICSLLVDIMMIKPSSRKWFLITCLVFPVASYKIMWSLYNSSWWNIHCW